MEISRKIVLIVLGVGLALVSGGIFIAYTFDSDRCLARSWDGFIADIESRDASGAAGCLAGDYSDAWGFTQQSLSVDLRRMMASLSHIKLTLSDVSVERRGGRAVISARVKMAASGYGFVTDATRQVNGLADPFVLYWKRDGLLPWRWKIVRIEQAQFDARRYGAGRGGAGLWPF